MSSTLLTLLIVLIAVTFLPLVVWLAFLSVLWFLSRMPIPRFLAKLPETTDPVRRTVGWILLVPAFLMLALTFPLAPTAPQIAAGLTIAALVLICSACLLFFWRRKPQ
jgi:hypothetical protein